MKSVMQKRRCPWQSIIRRLRAKDQGLNFRRLGYSLSEKVDRGFLSHIRDMFVFRSDMSRLDPRL